MNERLTALDAGFLQAEDSDSHASLAVAVLAIMEGPAPEFAELQAAVEERSAEVPRMRQMLHSFPLDISAPQWVTARNFDIAHHVRRHAVTAPGDDAAVYRAVAEVMERRLDRSRPLWETWVFDGLGDGRWAYAPTTVGLTQPDAERVVRQAGLIPGVFLLIALADRVHAFETLPK